MNSVDFCKIKKAAAAFVSATAAGVLTVKNLISCFLYFCSRYRGRRFSDMRI